MNYTIRALAGFGSTYGRHLLQVNIESEAPYTIRMKVVLVLMHVKKYLDIDQQCFD
jgi:hypothetical protein